MRSFYLSHHKSPDEETTAERWRGALLSEEACKRQQEVEDAAAHLLRYAFEIAPHSNNSIHMEELYKLKLAHHERVERRTGYGRPTPHPKGIEERVQVDGGPPLTLVIHPKHWEYTQRAEQSRQRRANPVEPAMDTGESQPSIEPEQVD